MHMTSTTAEWFKTKGRHKIYAGGHDVDMPEFEHTLKIIQDEPNSNGNGFNGNGHAKANGNGVGVKSDVRLLAIDFERLLAC